MEDATKPEPEPSSMTVSFLVLLDASIKGGSNAMLWGGSTYKFIAYAASLKTKSMQHSTCLYRFKNYQTLPAIPYWRIASS